MLGDKRFLRTIRLQNILSFGHDMPEFELKSLNVLVGPNGAGQSNLIEAISLLQAAPVNLLEPVRTGGGIPEWLWKGAASMNRADLDVTVAYPQGAMPLRHWLMLAKSGQRAVLVDEAIENERLSGPGATREDFYYRYGDV